MAYNTLNFMSYNSTGLDSMKCDWIRNIMKTCQIDFFQLQEHFKITKTLDSFFKREFPTNDSFVTPGHREPFQDAGRARGGLAQLSYKTLDMKKEKITTKHWRIQAQILHFNAYKLIWINCYFPTDPRTLQFDDGELLAVQNEIENVLDSNTFDDCVVGGDFNFDSSRISGFTSLMSDFLSRLGLVSVWQKFPIDFTHLHVDSKSSSVLDHFFVNKRLLDLVEDAGPVHLGDNLSRHSPIMMKLKLPKVSTKATQPAVPRLRRPAWYKATQDHKDQYTLVLDDKLKQLDVPDSLHCCDVTCQSGDHTEERDKHVLDILCALIETSYECIPLSSRSNSGETHKNVNQALPGWRENVAPLKNDSLSWHSIWISAGRPPSGSLYQVMCHARRKYHMAVRQAKRLAATAKAQALLTASEDGDIALMKELKKTLGSKSTGQSVPDCLEGKVTHETILEKFQECYKDLYNSAGTEQVMTIIKERLQGLISTSSNQEVEKVTGKIVKLACTRMKPGKIDVSEAYSSDVLLNAPDTLFDLLAGVFRSFLTHGTVTLQLLSCAFLPLFKGGLKNPEKFDSYRAIAGASQLLKLFEYVILIVWGEILDTDSMQFGFKKGVSTTQCSWLVNEVTTYFMRRGTAVTACLLDCSKAFDKCKFDMLFTKLMDKGLPPIVVRVLIFVYEEQTGWVKLAGKRSTPFSLTNGTRQGSVLSPVLFSVYLDDLLGELRKLQLGCSIGGCWFGGCGYADDLILLAPNREVLQKMLKICESYAADHNLIFSTDPVPSKSKTKCMYFCGRPGKVRYPEPVQLEGKDLPWVESADHLGHTLHQKTNMEKDCQRARARFIAKTVEIREQLSFAKPEQIMKAIQVLCTDAYGSMLWNLGSEKAEQFFKSWNTCVKLVYDVPRSTFTYLVEGFFAANHTSLRNQVLSRYPGFYRNLLGSPSREIRILARIVTNDPRSSTCANLKYLENVSNLNQPQFYSATRVKISLPVKEVPEPERWRLGLLTSLMKVKGEKYLRVEDTKHICAMLESLCNT